MSVFAVSAVAVVPAAALMGDSHGAARGALGARRRGAAERHVRQRPRADHRAVRALRRAARGRQGVARRIGDGQRAARARRSDARRRLAPARQHFQVESARSLDTVLVLGATALLVPSLVLLADGGEPAPHRGRTDRVRRRRRGLPRSSSRSALIAVYARGLRRSLRMQAEEFEAAAAHKPKWSRRRAGSVLALAALIVAVVSDTLVGSVEHTSHQLGLSQFFIGAIVVAIVGNAAEHYVAVVAATKDQMDLTLSIAVGSAAQVGLLLAPLVALASIVIGPEPDAAGVQRLRAGGADLRRMAGRGDDVRGGSLHASAGSCCSPSISCSRSRSCSRESRRASNARRRPRRRSREASAVRGWGRDLLRDGGGGLRRTADRRRAAVRARAAEHALARGRVRARRVPARPRRASACCTSTPNRASSRTSPPSR